MSSVVSVVPIPASAVFNYWPYVEYLLKEYPDTALGHDAVDLLTLVVAERLQLWIALDSQGEPLMAGLTEFRQFGTMKILVCVWAAGKKLHDVFPVGLAAFEQFAWDNDATSVAVMGREGFVKLLASLGYERVSTTVMKTIGKERGH